MYSVEPLIVVAACVLVAFVVGGLLCAYVYHRGLTKSSPLPPIIQSIAEPRPKPASVDPAPAPPDMVCQKCQKNNGWDLSDDFSVWTCKKCGKKINGPKPKIRA